MDDKFTVLESEVMRKIIAEDPNISSILAKQYNVAKIISRDFTGVGFFTNFEIIDKNLKIKDNLKLTLGNVQAKIDGLEFGVGFVLFVEDGLISMLEGYTYDEPWPDTITSYLLEYVYPKQNSNL